MLKVIFQYSKLSWDFFLFLQQQMVVCTSIYSNGRGQAEMTFESQNKEISFVVNIGIDTVDCILKEIIENYFHLFHRQPSGKDIVIWRKQLKEFIPKKIGRFHVFRVFPKNIIS